MSVVKMSKFTLTGLTAERDALLNALHKTQAADISSETEVSSEQEDIRVLHASAERIRKSIAFLTDQLDEAKKAEYYPEKLEGRKDAFLISYDEFMSVSEREEALWSAIAQSEQLAERLAECRAEKNKANSRKEQLSPYRAVPERFSDFSDTKYSRCFFGTIDEAALPKLEEGLRGLELAALTVYAQEKQCVISVSAHIDCADLAESLLGELSFSKCVFTQEETCAELTAKLDEEIRACGETEEDVRKQACGLCACLKDLKILSDYYSYRLEKAEAAERAFKTRSTFTLSGYVPAEKTDDVRLAVGAVSDAVVLEFCEPEADDSPPTLLKNKGPVKTAEFVTNMYSVPDYREIDPNNIVFLFFMIFFGLIMADIGYGLLLFVGGLIVCRRIKINSGVRKLASIMLYGGLFTAVFGALFGSCFGFSLYTLLPDPSSGNRTDVLTILLGCLAMGLLQITVGYVMKAANSLKDGKVVDALCDAFTWILFNVGLFFAVFNFITGYFEIVVPQGVREFFDTMTLPGVIMLVAGLAGAALTAGRKEKLIGKFTKGFGAVYGVINLLSDVLSYARLFGLMLSGMIIAQQFNGIGMDLIAAGGLGIAFGPLVMVIGHAFNISMGVLGAYIHDCRLQYIEFFSKFYTGEGRLFAPLGSRGQYIYIQQ